MPDIPVIMKFIRIEVMNPFGGILGIFKNTISGVEK
jgi:hypothetical protein